MPARFSPPTPTCIQTNWGVAFVPPLMQRVNGDIAATNRITTTAVAIKNGPYHHA